MMRTAFSILGTMGALFGSFIGSDAFAQQAAFEGNLLANPGFEINDANNFGNNIRNSVPNWFIGGGERPNIVRVDGAGGFEYENGGGRPFGPQFDAQNNGVGAGAGVIQHYLDIVGGTNSVFQTFQTPTCDVAPLAPVTWTVSGWISGRDERTSGFGELRIRLGNDLNAPIVLSDAGNSPRVEITSPDDTSRWTQVVAQYTLEQGTEYTFEAIVDDNANFDEGSVIQDGFVCPEVEAQKSVSSVEDTNGNGIFGDVGDSVNYAFFIENTGSAALANISISDAGPELGSGTFTLSQPAPGFDGDLAPGEGPTLVATAVYVLTLDDVLNGDLSNAAEFSAQPVAVDGSGNPDPASPLPGFPLFTQDTDTGSGPDIDQNDGSTLVIANPSGTDSDGVPGNDASETTVLTLPPLAPSLTLGKAADTSGLSTPPTVGDILTFTFTVTNTGNIDLDQADTLPIDTMTYGQSGTGAAVATPMVIARASASADNNDGILQQGEVITFQGSFTLDQLAIDSGGVSNTATSQATAVDPSGNNLAALPPVMATSDNDAAADGIDGPADANGNNPTVVDIAGSSALSIIKSASAAFSDPPATGDIVTFTYAVTNTGSATVFNVEVTESAGGFTGTGLLPAPIGQSGGTDEDSGAGTLDLLPGATLIFAADYAITDADIAAGVLGNSATASGTDLNGAPVTDTSDAGSDAAGDPIANPGSVETPDSAGNTDANPANDPTVLAISSPPVALDVSVTAPTPGAPVIVPNVTANDTDVDGVVQPDRVSLVVPVGATAITDADGDVISVTVPGEGVWAVDDAGNVTFTPEARFEGDPTPIGYTVLDDDGNRSNPATITVTYTPAPAISVEKSADLSGLQSPPRVGNQIVYSYVVRNTGNVTLFDVRVDEQTGSFSGTGPLPTPVYVSGGADLDFDLDAFDLAPGGGTILFRATYRLTQADINAGGVTNQALAAGDNVTGAPVTDVSDDPADTTNTQDNGDPADPTVVTLDQLAAIELVKVVLSVPDTNGDGLFGGEGDTVFYGFTVFNTGNVTLTNITVADPLFPVTGGPISLAAGAADDTTFRGQFVVGPADITRGFIENTATVSAQDANGAIISDVSDTGTDPDVAAIANPGAVDSPDGLGARDADPTNDPTVLSVPANPNPGLALIKSISAVVDLNGNDITDAGDRIDYVFSVTNTGNLSLTNITVTDPLLTVSGVIASLDVLQTNATDLTGSYVIAPGDVTAGFVENTAQATGLAVNSLGDPVLDPVTGDQLSATDTSDSGTAPDLDAGGNPVSISSPGAVETPNGAGGTDGLPGNDPTVLRIPMPQIELIKSVFGIADTNGDGLVGGPDDVITFAFTVTNTGTVDLTNVTVGDALATVTGGPIAFLGAGQSNSLTFRATYTVTPADITNGFVENTATTTGTAVDENGDPFFGPGGVPVQITDISDTGTASDGSAVGNPSATETPAGNGSTDANPTNDATVVTVPANPQAEIALVKSAVGAADTNNDFVTGAFGDLLTYSFAVTNTGNFPLGDVVVNDPRLGGQIGTIPLLRVNETITLSFDYEITFDDFVAGEIENSATATGNLTNASGMPIIDSATGNPITATDTSDSGTNSDLSPVNNPAATETPDAAGATNGDPTDDPTVTQIPVIPSGAAISGLFFIDNNANNSFESGVDAPSPGVTVNLLNAAGQIVGTAVTDANGFYEISGFPVGQNFSVQFIDSTTGAVLDSITALSFGPNTVLENQNGLQAAVGASNLVLTKTTTRDTVILGDSVPYAITLTNTGSGPVPAVDIVDTLPTGLAFINGTATLDGTGVIPVLQGRTITFSNVFVPPSGSVEIALFATVLPTAPFGDLTNIVRVIDPVSRAVLAEASATVERLPEAVFDCSDIIGKVFDDRNFNGYQDPAQTAAARDGAVSNQSIFNGKFAVAGDAAQRSAGEPGLPGVRLLTATGTQITTDEFGRYSVPCAELAGPIGTNFTLKLDPKSLPTGYRITTENPRTMRLTAGIATEMNFGAALGRVLDVDLTAAAFAQDVPVERLDQGLTQLLRQVADTPSVVRISYFTNGETLGTAKTRIKAVEDVIEDRWRRIGNYRLIVETTIKQLQ